MSMCSRGSLLSQASISFNRHHSEATQHAVRAIWLPIEADLHETVTQVLLHGSISGRIRKISDVCRLP
jgi:hypothetical protein